VPSPVGAEPAASRGDDAIWSSVGNACSTHCFRPNTLSCSPRPPLLAAAALRAPLGMDGPPANGSAQLVGLLLHLPHPLRFHSKIATEFHDLTFNNIRQFGGWRPPVRTRRAPCGCGLRHSIPSYRRS
jgi:hypothetical protein